VLKHANLKFRSVLFFLSSGKKSRQKGGFLSRQPAWVFFQSFLEGITSFALAGLDNLLNEAGHQVENTGKGAFLC